MYCLPWNHHATALTSAQPPTDWLKLVSKTSIPVWSDNSEMFENETRSKANTIEVA